MTQIGEGAYVSEIPEGGSEKTYFLQFKLVDENGKPIIGLPYKAIKAGASAEPGHIADGKTNTQGNTNIVSSTKDEEIDLYFVWAKLMVNKGFFKA